MKYSAVPGLLLLASLCVPLRAAEPSIRLVRDLGDPTFRHGGTISHVLPLPDGRVVTTARDGTARLWDANGKQLRDVTFAKEADVWNARLLPDGKEVLLAATGQPLRTLSVEDGASRALTAGSLSTYRFSQHEANGLLAIASGKESGGILLFDPAVTNQWKRIPTGQTQYSVQFSHDGERVLAGGDGKTLAAWKVSDAVAADAPAPEPAEEDDADAAADPFAGEGDRDGDGDAKPDPAAIKERVKAAVGAALKVEKRELRRERKPAPKLTPASSLDVPSDVYTIAPAPDRRRYLVVCDDKHVLLVEEAPGLVEKWRVELPAEAQNAAWSPDGTWIAIAVAGGKLHRLNPADGSLTDLAALPVAEHWAIAFSADGATLLVSVGSLLCRFDAATGARQFPPPEVEVIPALSGLVAEADGGRLFSSTSRTVVEIDPADGRVKRKVGVAEDLDGLSQIPNGPLLLRGSPSGLMERDGGRMIVKWNDDARMLSGMATWVKGGEALRDAASDYQRWARGYDQSLRSIAFSPDGTRLGVASYQTLSIWNTRTGKALAELDLSDVKGQHFNTSHLVFGPAGGPLLAAMGYEGMLLWNSAGGGAGPAPADAEVAAWIHDLGDSSFAKRRDASQRLEKAGAAVLEALEKAAADEDDPEVSSNAQELLERIQASLTPRNGVVLILLKGDSWVTSSLAATHLPGIFALARGGEKPAVVLVREKGGKLEIIAEAAAPGRPRHLTLVTAGGEKNLYSCNANGTISVFRIE